MLLHRASCEITRVFAETSVHGCSPSVDGSIIYNTHTFTPDFLHENERKVGFFRMKENTMKMFTMGVSCKQILKCGGKDTIGGG